MNPDLRQRLLRFNADVSESGVDPAMAVWLACDLLVAGVETPAVIELAGESPTRLDSHEAFRLAGQVLDDLGIPRLSDEQVDWVNCRDLARDILSGKVEPDHWACCSLPRLGVLWREDDVRALADAAFHDPGTVADRVHDYAREFVRVSGERLEACLP